jgi:hypothetical protein
MSTVDGTRIETNIVPSDENEMKSIVTPFVGTSIQPSNAAVAQSPSTENVRTLALPFSNETYNSSSTLSSWCRSNQRPDHHGNESIPLESAGERILSTHGEKTVTVSTGTTTKQFRTVSLGEDEESSPVTKRRKSITSTIYPNDYNQSTTTSNRTLLQHNLPLIAPRQLNTSKITLLANPKDKLVLSDLHVFVRQQIEVFTATESDITQPAPGRKNRIQLNQVGLRCIHCRNLPARDRVKRAVCYPSSIARVYHSVSDMKFDHFNHCKGRSPEICALFQSLKEQKQSKKAGKLMNHTSSSSTAQYYHDTALEMGMVDGPGGLYMVNTNAPAVVTSTASSDPSATNFGIFSPSSSAARYLHVTKTLNHAMNFMDMKYDPQDPSPANFALHRDLPLLAPRPSSTITLLADPRDKLVLSQLHIFVRQQIEVFTATVSEMTQPAPGRKIRVVFGQVGLRCIHCANIPIKDRVKRAVCYPAAISGIYHAVSNMKFDHFNKCRALPAHEREIFASLRSSCGRHGPRNSSSKCVSNSTAQYYHDSAIALGLVDSENGIRFQDASAAPSTHLTPGQIRPVQSKMPCNLTIASNSSTDGISALMIAAQQQQKINIINS